MTALNGFHPVRVGGRGYRGVILSEMNYGGLPVGYWRLGEISSTIAIDEMTVARGSGVTGSYLPNSSGAWTGGTLGQPAALSRDNNPSALFNSTTGRVSLGSSFAQSGSFSVEGWAYPTSFGSNPQIISRAENGGGFRQNYLLFIRTPANVWSFQTNSAGGTNEVLGAAVTLNKWSHVAATYTSTGASNPVLRIYLDGELSNTDSTGANTDADASLITSIGSYAGAVNFWPGLLAEVAVYNYALDANRVRAHAYAGFNGN